MGNSLKKDASEAGDSLNDKRKQLESEKPKVPVNKDGKNGLSKLLYKL